MTLYMLLEKISTRSKKTTEIDLMILCKCFRDNDTIRGQYVFQDRTQYSKHGCDFTCYLFVIKTARTMAKTAPARVIL